MTENPSFDLQLEIDRLVGGELDKPAQRKLVEVLDATPDGWRCCALAFMEARSWSAAFGGLLVDEENDSPPATVRPPRSTDAGEAIGSSDVQVKSKTAAAPPGSPARVRLVAATVALATFAAGIGVSSLWKAGANGVSTTRVEGNLAEQRKPAGALSTQPREAPQPQPNRQDELVGLVSISNNGVTESAFAVVGGDDFNGPPPQFSQPPVADYVRQVWRRKGYAIEQHRKVVSVRLNGGRRLDFPIDWVQYRYVGQPVF